MNHICRIEMGSNGAPMLNLMNNKVIGMSIITNDNFILINNNFYEYGNE